MKWKMIINYKHGNLVLSKLLTIINGLRKYMAPEKTSIRHKQSFSQDWTIKSIKTVS